MVGVAGAAGEASGLGDATAGDATAADGATGDALALGDDGDAT